MWLLLIVFLVQTPGTPPATVLNRFATEAACQRARDHVGYWMADAYPYERDFIVLCLQRGQEIGDRP